MANLSCGERLHNQHRQWRDRLQPAQNLRLHRAISWLKAAEQCSHQDGQFLFLWVSFNAAYASEVGGNQYSETRQFEHYLARIVSLDNDHRLYTLVWEKYASAIRLLLDNRYVFQPYWDWANAIDTERDQVDWKGQFEKAKQKSHRALAENDVLGVLQVVFKRLYTLRNQLVHGGATFASSVNRRQIDDACHILADLMPVILELMMTPTTTLWGEGIYPVMDD